MKSGQRLRSQACAGEVIVIRATDTSGELMTNGLPLLEPSGDVTQRQTDGEHEGFRLGKRYEYAEGDTRIEVMVTRAGAHPLTYQGHALVNSATKALPTSD